VEKPSGHDGHKREIARRPAELREIRQPDESGRARVGAAMEQLQMSARTFHRILELARTIADLAKVSRRLAGTHQYPGTILAGIPAALPKRG
jgi:predicted ATPase with chaperone activity